MQFPSIRSRTKPDLLAYYVEAGRKREIMVDYDKAKAEQSRHDQDHERTVIRRVVALNRSVERRLGKDPNDPAVELVEVILGAKSGGKEKATELLAQLGFTTNPTATEAGPIALVANTNADKGYGPDVTIVGGIVYLPEVDATGTQLAAGASQQMDDVVKNHFHLVRKDGLIYGFSRGVAAPPASTQDPNQLVPVWNEQGNDTKNKITIKDGEADADKYKKIEANGQIVAFMMKPRTGLIRRRRSSN